MRRDLTKAQRRRIRELAGIAYDRELSRELTTLESAHDSEIAWWRASLGATIAVNAEASPGRPS